MRHIVVFHKSSHISIIKNALVIRVLFKLPQQIGWHYFIKIFLTTVRYYNMYGQL